MMTLGMSLACFLKPDYRRQKAEFDKDLDNNDDALPVDINDSAMWRVEVCNNRNIGCVNHNMRRRSRLGSVSDISQSIGTHDGECAVRTPGGTIVALLPGRPVWHHMCTTTETTTDNNTGNMPVSPLGI